MMSRRAVQAAALGAFMGFAAMPSARAQAPAPPVVPAISEEAGAAVSRMARTLLSNELSFTARTIRVYLDDSGQPLHVFHTMRVVARRPNRLVVRVTGDDGSHDLFYDGTSASVFSPDRREYAVVAAPGDIPSALNEVLQKLNIGFPMGDFFADAPDRSLLQGAVAGWQVGTAKIDGVECRHLFFIRRGGIELELWVEKDGAAIPRRLIVTHRLLPGQPNLIAEFTDWNPRAHTSDADFIFRPPTGARRIELRPAGAP